mgnify:CR=1 FL=1
MSDSITSEFAVIKLNGEKYDHRDKLTLWDEELAARPEGTTLYYTFRMLPEDRPREERGDGVGTWMGNFFTFCQ